MLDPMAIAAATLIAKWAAESFVKEAAKSSVAALQPIYEWARAKFVGDPAAETALTNVVAAPGDETSASGLAQSIHTRLQNDPALRKELSQLLDQAKEDGNTHSFVIQVMENAKVGKLVSIGTVIGNVTF